MTLHYLHINKLFIVYIRLYVYIRTRTHAHANIRACVHEEMYICRQVHAREIGHRQTHPCHMLMSLFSQNGKTALELASTDEVKAAFAEHAAV